MHGYLAVLPYQEEDRALGEAQTAQECLKEEWCGKPRLARPCDNDPFMEPRSGQRVLLTQVCRQHSSPVRYSVASFPAGDMLKRPLDSKVVAFAVLCRTRRGHRAQVLGQAYAVLEEKRSRQSSGIRAFALTAWAGQREATVWHRV